MLAIHESGGILFCWRGNVRVIHAGISLQWALQNPRYHTTTIRADLPPKDLIVSIELYGEIFDFFSMKSNADAEVFKDRLFSYISKNRCEEKKATFFGGECTERTKYIPICSAE